MPDHRDHLTLSTLLDISEEDYKTYNGQQGKYWVRIEYAIYQYCPVTTIPLKVGEKYRKGSATFTIDSISQHPEGYSVMLQEQYFDLLLKKQRTPEKIDKYIYLLVNKERQEVFLNHRVKNTPVDALKFNSILNSKSKNLLYVSNGDPETGNLIDEEWMENAQLMIIQARWMGCSEIMMETDDTFSFGKAKISRTDRQQ